MDHADGKARALVDELVQRAGEPGPTVRPMASGTNPWAPAMVAAGDRQSHPVAAGRLRHPVNASATLGRIGFALA